MIYYLKSDNVNAGISAGSTLPLGDLLFKGGKKCAKAADKLNDARKLGRVGEDTVRSYFQGLWKWRMKKG